MNDEKWFIRLTAERAFELTKQLAIRDKMPTSLAGMCSRGSVILATMLTEAGYNPTICENYYERHTFVVVNRMIVDVTARQFGNHRRDIYISDREQEKLPRPYRRVDWVFDSVDEYMKFASSHIEKSEIPRKEDIEDALRIVRSDISK